LGECNNAGTDSVLEKARDEATWLAVYRRLVEALDSAALDSLKRNWGRSW
jgi:hypothetical protein